MFLKKFNKQQRFTNWSWIGFWPKIKALLRLFSSPWMSMTSLQHAHSAYRLYFNVYFPKWLPAFCAKRSFCWIYFLSRPYLLKMSSLTTCCSHCAFCCYKVSSVSSGCSYIDFKLRGNSSTFSFGFQNLSLIWFIDGLENQQKIRYRSC